MLLLQLYQVSLQADASRLPGDAVPAALWVGGAWLVLGTLVTLAARRRGGVGLAWWLVGAPFVVALGDGWGWLGLAVALLPLLAIAGRWAGVAVAPWVLGASAVQLAAPASEIVVEQRGAPVVLVTLDTVRADHVGAVVGAQDSLTPELDALAARGVLFTEGVAPAPLTSPSHTAMLTGLEPVDSGVVRNGDALSTSVGTVAERFAREGWRTGAFVAASVLDRRFGLDRGFQHYDDRFSALHRTAHLPPVLLWDRWGWAPEHNQRPGEEVVERALRWLDSDPGRAFVWVHLYDAHSPYRPAPESLEALPPREPVEVEPWLAWRKQWFPGPRLPLFLPPHRVDDLARAYAAEITEVDAHLGRLVQALPEGSRLVVAADHGESLAEHAYVLNHGRHVFQASLRVPVVVVDGSSTGVVHEPVPLRLVGPTLLELAGMGGEIDLLDLREQPWSEPIYSFTLGQESHPALGLGLRKPELAERRGSSKRIVAGDGRAWHFDLASDPQEAEPQPMSDDASLRERLEAWSEQPEQDDDMVQWLESLGYVD